MLDSLNIKNFKAWREADLTFGKVTGLFGTNSAGKSSLLHFLLLLKQTRNATDRGLVLDFGEPKDLVDLGTFTDVVHKHDEEEKICWCLDWTLPELLQFVDKDKPDVGPLLQGNNFKIQCEVGLRQERPWPYRLSYWFDCVEFSLKPQSDSMEHFELATHRDTSPEFHFERAQDHIRSLPRPGKTHLFPNQVRSLYQNTDFLGDFELEYENLMDSLYYLGPLREPPRRDYRWVGASPSDVGQRGERAVDAILAATRDQEKRPNPDSQEEPKITEIPFQGVIAYWLKKLGLLHEFYLEEIAKGTNLYRTMVKTSPSSVPTALTDVGFGVSQVLPVLVLLYYVPKSSTVLMEQPEIHLHPAVQSGLADVMLEVVESRDIQIIVESHSEHLMRRLQLRVAEQKASSEDVKLYFVSSQEGQARISKLDLNEWGEIENWPDKFFGDEMGEIAAITEASLRRKMEQSG